MHIRGSLFALLAIACTGSPVITEERSLEAREAVHYKRYDAMNPFALASRQINLRTVNVLTPD